MQSLRISLLQMDLAWENAEQNRKQVDTMLRGFKEETDLILLPEMFTTGFTMNVEQNFEEMEGPTIQWMQKLAARKKCWIGGSLIIKEDGSYYNRFVFVNKDGLVGEYDKRHLFRLAKEDDYIMEGREFLRVQLKGWNIAPLICYDLRFPVWSRNRKAKEGLAFDLLIYVASWPSKRINHWDALLKARAIENQCFVAGLNRVGNDGNSIPYNGSSAIINHMGEILEHQVDTAKILHQTLDPAMMLKYREKFPFWMDGDIFEILI
ncbi:MAG: amidohydrolase [Bacteroidia bacterium]|nr:amidohydrolase [Bacteroidia bacterium]